MNTHVRTYKIVDGRKVIKYDILRGGGVELTEISRGYGGTILRTKS